MSYYGIPPGVVWDDVRGYHYPPQPVLSDNSQPPEIICDCCGGQMIEKHCKLVCLRCGYKRDCSDP